MRDNFEKLKKCRFIGITGSIASGKSTLVRLLLKRNYSVIDCDKLARQAVAPDSPCMADIRREFGNGIFLPDGSLNRTAMAGEIYTSNAKKQKLERIIHPFVETLLSQNFTLFKQHGEKIVFADVPLLFEAGWQYKFDQVWLVICPDKIRIQRLMARDNFDRDEAECRMSAQMPQADKIKLADVIIDNSGTEQELEIQLNRLLAELFYEKDEKH